MKFTYHSTTEDIEIEVSEDWAEILVDFDRQEKNNNRKESRRHYHYDADDVYEGSEYGEEDADLLALFPSDAEDEVMRAMSCLTDSQRDVIQMLFLEGLPAKEYAKRKGVSDAAVSKAKSAALKKMKIFLLDG